MGQDCGSGTPERHIDVLTCSSHLSCSPFPDLVFREVALGLVLGMSKFQSRLRDDAEVVQHVSDQR